jgi:hypothetical protein
MYATWYLGQRTLSWGPTGPFDVFSTLINVKIWKEYNFFFLKKKKKKREEEEEEKVDR